MNCQVCALTSMNAFAQHHIPPNMTFKNPTGSFLRFQPHSDTDYMQVIIVNLFYSLKICKGLNITESLNVSKILHSSEKSYFENGNGFKFILQYNLLQTLQIFGMWLSQGHFGVSHVLRVPFFCIHRSHTGYLRLFTPMPKDKIENQYQTMDVNKRQRVMIT